MNNTKNRCEFSGQVIGNKPAVLVKNVVLYLKKQGYIVSNYPLKIFLIFSVLLLISNISAIEYEKEFIKNNDYGEISIQSKFGEKVIKYTLLENTDFCIINCQASGIAEVYYPIKLYENMIFKKNREPSNILEYKVFYSNSSKINFKVVDDYENNCIENIQNQSTNCEKIKVGSHLENYITPIWEDATDKVLSIGSYLWKITGKKQYDEDIDWVIETDKSYGSFQLHEWASWNNSFNVGLTDYFKLNESSGTIALNSIRPTHNFTGSQSKWVNGIISNSLNVSGKNFNSTNSIDYNQTFSGVVPYSVSVWLYPTPTIEGNFLGKGVDNANMFYFGVGPDSKLDIFYKYDGGSYYAKTITIPFNINQWQHVVITYNQTGTFCMTCFTVYLNGTSYPFETSRGTPFFGAIGNSDLLHIGSGADDDQTWYYWHGYIDELAIYNRSLNPNEVSDLYNNHQGLTYIEDRFNYPPNLTIISPKNQTYYSSIITYEVFAQDTDIDSCWYSLNTSIINYTMTNVSFNYSYINNSVVNGSQIIYFYCNDSLNQLNFSSVSFHVGNTDTTIFIIDYDNNFTTMIFFVMFCFSVILVLYRFFILGGSILVLNGIILLFSSFNPIISAVIIIMGALCYFAK